MSESPAAQPAPETGSSSASLARSSALMASGTLVSRLLGLARIALLAGAIGVTTQVSNVWQTANTLPNTIYLLLAGGVLNVVFVPQLTRALAREDKGRDFTDRLITLALTAIIVITVIATAGAWVLTKLYALSWTGDQLALAVALAYLCLPQIFFYGAYALLGQILNAQEKFGYYMWAPVANNIVAIAGLIAFTIVYPDASTMPLGQWTGSMIWLLGGTATLGIGVQAAVLIQPVRRSGFRYRPRWGFRGVGLGSASRMAVWTLAIIAVSQTGLLFASNVLNRAAVLQDGIAGKFAYDNAFLIFILPHSLIATSLLTAMLPRLSRAAAADNRALLAEQYRHGLRLLATAMVPIAVLMIIMAPQITALLLLLSGSQATQAIAEIVMILTVGLVPYGIYLLSQRIFHAYQEGRPPFQLQVVITAVSSSAIAAAAFLPAEYTAMGIAAGQALGQIVAAVLAVMWVRRRIDFPKMGDVRRTYLRALGAALLAAVPTAGIQLGVYAVLDGKVAALVTLGVGGLVFVALYGGLAHTFGIRELSEVITPLTRRVRRRPRPSPPDVVKSTTSSSSVSSTSDSPATTPNDPHQTKSRLNLDSSASTQEMSKKPMVHGIDTGTVLGGRYALEELLARRDDTLDYWSAHDQTLDRLVAVTLLPATGEHEAMADAVLDGARRTAGVDDPRLVRVLDVGSSDGICWIVEEGLSEAISLASLVAEQPLPAEEARRIVGEAASGMESARRRGLHHLYLNPHAVLRTREGSIKISGVGVAAAIEATDDISASEASVIDTTDLLSLLYTALTGRWPGEEIEALRPARRLADGSLPAPSEVVAGVPGDLDALCREVFGAGADGQAGPNTPGELAKVLAPWPSEVVQGTPSPLDAPLGEEDGGAYAALAAAAGASAAASAAHPGDPESGEYVDKTTVVEPSYYRTQPAPGATAGDDDGFGGDSGGASAMPGSAAGAGAASVTAAPATAASSAGSGSSGSGSSGSDPDSSVESASTAGAAAGAGAGAGGAGAAHAGAGAVGAGAGGADAAHAGAGGSSAGGPPPGDETALASTPGSQGPQRFQSSVVLTLIAAVVVVAMFLGYGAIRGLGGDDSSAAGPTASPTSDSSSSDGTSPDAESSTEDSADSDKRTEEPTKTPGEPLEIAGITSHDPEGDGDENNELADLAIDGDATTSWRSRTYLSPNWGNLKDGVGLALDLGDSESVSEVDVTFPEGDYGMEVYVGDEVSLADMTRIGTDDDATDEVTVEADEPVKGRYVLVWFDRAWAGPNGEIVYVSEVTVR